MGRSSSNPHLTRKENKERKEKQKFFQVKRYRKEKLGGEKQKEHAVQQQLTHHTKAIIQCKVMELQKKRAAEQQALREDDDDDDDEEEEEEEGDDALDNLQEASDDDNEEDDEEEGEDDGDDEEDDDDDDDDEDDVNAATADALASSKVTFRITGTRYKVVSPGVVVRETADLTSPSVGRLATDAILDVVELQGRRGRIVNPLVGWVSILAQDKAMICQRDYEAHEFDDEFDVAAEVDDAGDDELSDDEGLIVDEKGKVVGGSLPGEKKKEEKKKGRRAGGKGQQRDRAQDRKRKRQEKQSSSKRGRW